MCVLRLSTTIMGPLINMSLSISCTSSHMSHFPFIVRPEVEVRYTFMLVNLSPSLNFRPIVRWYFLLLWVSTMMYSRTRVLIPPLHIVPILHGLWNILYPLINCTFWTLVSYKYITIAQSPLQSKLNFSGTIPIVGMAYNSYLFLTAFCTCPPFPCHGLVGTPSICSALCGHFWALGLTGVRELISLHSCFRDDSDPSIL